MRKSLLFLPLILISGHYSLYAWGKKGHQLIAQIAKSQMEVEVIESVNAYLKGMSWEDMACWMEDAKVASGPNYLKEWHYVCFSKDKTYVKKRTPDAFNQLDYYIRVLKNRSMFSTEAVFEALKIIFHLVGDISQPIHCGYPEDKCGTNAFVKYMDRTCTLHDVWDTEIIEERKIDLWTCSKTTLELSSEEKNDIRKVSPLDWLNDSRRYLKQAYDFNDGLIDKDYVDRSAPLIEKQLVKAGLRLAAILEANFK